MWMGIRWMEWFSLAMLFVTLGLPLFFLFQSLKRHHLDDLDCTKFEVFTTDTYAESQGEPAMPRVCQPGFAQTRPWAHQVNVQWVWVTVGIGFLWALIMLGAFIASRGIESLRSSLPT